MQRPHLPRPRPAARAAALLALLPPTAGLASAHLVSGTVTGPSGAPVANVDIDAFDAVTGNELVLSGDFTNAAGAFAVDVPTGVYRFVFRAPAPPVTTLLDTSRENVLVTAPVALGVVTLGAGVSLAGRVVDVAGLPQAGIDLDFLDGATGAALATSAGATDALGRFLVAVPPGALDLEVEPDPARLPRLAPRRFELVLSANSDLGDIVLQPGFLVSATVRRANLTPVPGVDVDVRRSATGEGVHTPGDDTDAMGFVDVVLAAGTYDVQFCPALATSLVSAVMRNVTVNADVHLGFMTLQAGVRLSGRVTNTSGAPLEGVDVDLRLPGTLIEVPLCNDDTNGNGDYAVTVPLGTFDVVFEPRFTSPYASRTQPATLIAAATTLNATLSACGTLAPSGAGRAGTGGIVPTLDVTGGSLRIPNPDLVFTVRNGRGGARAYVLSGVAPASGLNLPAGAPPRPRLHLARVNQLTLSGAAGAAGVGSAALPYPLDVPTAFVGRTFFVAAWVQDPGAVGGYAWTAPHTGVLCN